MNYMDQLIKTLKVLADKSRLKILAAINKEPSYQELLAKQLKLNPSTVSFHLKKLEDQNLIIPTKEQYYKVYHINKEALNFNLLHLLDDIKLEQTEEDRIHEYEEQVKKTFFKNGKLTQIPVQRKKRDIILREIAKDFQINKEYTEKEVNVIIMAYHFDFCTIRREFIMNKMFSRDNGIYKRLK